MMRTKTTTLLPLEVNALSTYIRTIDLDYQYDNNAELAALIQDVFGVECTKNDIDNYQMNFVHEDYEKISRTVEYGKREDTMFLPSM